MKHAHIGAILNFDLCDLQKVGQIKNPGIMSCILIRCTYDKTLEMIQPLVQEHFVGFPRWLPGGHICSRIGPKFSRNIDGA
jgi:hypothetical protein